MLDRVTEFRKGISAAGIKNITLTDDILHDHFPDYPVFPGAMLIEAMAQLGGFLLEMSVNTKDSIRRALLAQIDKAKFHNLAEPGDQLRLSAELDEQIDDAAKVNITVQCGDSKIANAKLTFVLKPIEFEKIHAQRRDCYRLWTKKLIPSVEIF
jgi:3-hydroxyacyl-[acyl-carrier-protein] dehydratase